METTKIKAGCYEVKGTDTNGENRTFRISRNDAGLWDVKEYTDHNGIVWHGEQRTKREAKEGVKLELEDPVTT